MKSRKFFTVAISLLLLLVLVPSLAFAAGVKEEQGVKAGDEINMTILGIGGWLPSALAVEMSDLFADYAKTEYGYDVTFRFEEAPFSNLFQKAATSLATQSQEYNIIISDSQWLGALSEPGWIVQLNDIIDESEILSKTEWYDPIVEKSYMAYPDGSTTYWGLPQEGDVLVLYVRKDMLEDPIEKRNFKKQYGYDLPQTFEDFIDVSIDEYEDMLKFFTRPEEDFYGVAIQYSKEYDYMTGSMYPFIWSSGGEIWDPKTKNVEGILNTSENAKALEKMVSLQDYAPPGCINYGIGDISQAYTQGKVFSGFQWAAEGISMIPDHMKDKTIAVPPPGYRQPDGSVQRIYSLGGQPWVINKFNDKAHMDVAEIQPWHRVYKYMLTESHANDFWHEPTYAEMLAYQQEKFTSFAAAYLEGRGMKALDVLNDVAREHQRILFDAGATDTPPSTR
jgi:multiple sugar transport system substrate-binding protein